jgi:predicted amidophosphoribosyltransferase
MNKNRNADGWNVRKSNPIDFLNGNQKAVSAFDFNKNKPFGQCVGCRSDYMKFASGGYCQDCLQRVEYIVREHPHILRKIQNQGGNQK